jgi:hypothetical protein
MFKNCAWDWTITRQRSLEECQGRDLLNQVRWQAGRLKVSELFNVIIAHSLAFSTDLIKCPNSKNSTTHHQS